MKKYLSLKILIPALIVLFSGLITLTIIAGITMKNSLTKTMIETTNFSLDDLIAQSLDNTGQITFLKVTMADNYIQLAKLLAQNLEENAENLSTEEYIEMAKEVGVAEIHVTDENGVLEWGSVAGFYGFDFHTSDQTKPFLKILTDSNYALAQEPQSRAVDGVLFQYISVSRRDQPGIVQIGIKAHVIQEVIDRVDTQKLIDSFNVDEYGGSTFIIATDGTTLKHKNRDVIGLNVFTEFPWGSNFEDVESGQFYYTHNDTEKFLSYRRFGEEIYCASVFVEPYINPVKNMNRVMIITSALFGIVLAFLIIFLIRNIASNPLRKLNNKISILAEGEGDLTQNIKINSTDEVGQLATGINDFISSLRVIVSNIKKASTETQIIKESLNMKAAGSSTTFNKISASVTNINNEIATLDEQINKSRDISKSIENEIDNLDREVENQVSAVEESTASVNQMVASLKNVSIITTNKSQATQQLVETTRSGGEKIILLNRLVEEIQQSVTDISQMVSIIDDIASRTSLLSMNAAIEAAHAGDQGKGFAVVADEIRKLSESTANNAKSINQVLENIRGQVDEATTASGETNSAFNEINKEVHSVSEALSEIKLAAEELSNGGEQIIDAMYILQEVSTKVRSGAIEMKQGATLMGHSMNNVKDISGKVLHTVSDIADESNLIAQGSDDLNTITKELSDNTRLLDNEISRFKTE